MIIENMKLVLNQEQMDKLKSEENKMEFRMQKQLMQMSEFADGTILREIDRINRHLNDKLMMEVDLGAKLVI